MSRGQQGIGISAAGMYGLLTTGKPVKIISKVSPRKPAHYYEIQIDTKKNQPEILNGRGEGVEVPPGETGRKAIEKHGIEWIEQDHGTRVTIELEARYQRGRGSVDEYLEQTAIANPHVDDPLQGSRRQRRRTTPRAAEELPPEPKEIKPHPYGVELGLLVTMLKDTKAPTLSQFLTQFVLAGQPGRGRQICEAAKLSTRAIAQRGSAATRPTRCTRRSRRRRSAPRRPTASRRSARSCCSRGCTRWCRASSTSPPRGRRPSIAAIRFRSRSAWPTAARQRRKRCSLEALTEMLGESDARTLRQFLITTFNGLGPDGGRQDSRRRPTWATRVSPAKLKADRDRPAARGHAERESQRGPDDERAAVRQPRAAAVPARRLRHHADRDEHQLAGLRPEPVARLAAQRAGHRDGPHGQRLGAVHQRIERGRRLLSGDPERIAAGPAGGGPQAGHVPAPPAEGASRKASAATSSCVTWAKWPSAVSEINEADREELYDQLLDVAKRKTAEADVKLDDRGRKVEPKRRTDFGDNVLIVEHRRRERTRRRTAARRRSAACFGRDNERRRSHDRKSMQSRTSTWLRPRMTTR